MHPDSERRFYNPDQYLSSFSTFQKTNIMTKELYAEDGPSIDLTNIQGQIIDGFEILEQFGSGGFGRVHFARHIPTSTYCAAKIVNLIQQSEGSFMGVLHEVSVFMQVSHPALSRLFHLSQVSDLLIFFMEYVSNGTLSAYVRSYDYGIPEAEAQRLFRQIFSAIRHCHAYHFLVHRDLKLDNILLDSQMNAKLIDFGLSDTFYCNTLHAFVGTPGYTAPEVMSGNEYDDRCDVWSLGMCLYKMVVGRFPFDSQWLSSRDLVREAENITFPDRLTPQLVDILRRMLAPHPNKRLSLAQLQSHPYLAPLEPLSGNVVPRPIVFYRVNTFHDIRKFTRSPCSADPELVKKCLPFAGCSEAEIVSSVEEGKLNLATTVYFIMIEPLVDRPTFGSRLPPLQRSKRPPKVPCKHRPDLLTVGGTKLPTISGKPFALVSNPLLNKRPVIPSIKHQRPGSVPKY
jgi:serine/threonine protein kinase